MKLSLFFKDPYEWNRFLQANQADKVRVILIHSKSVRVIEAKLKVYKEYQAVIDSSNIFLQHVHDDFDEITELNVYNKLTRLCDDVETLCKSINLKYLDKILKTAVDSALTESGLCLENYGNSKKLSEKRNRSLQTIMKYLNSLEIDFAKLVQVKPLIKRKNHLDLPLKLKMQEVLTEIFKSNTIWIRDDEYFNAEEMKKRAAVDISCTRRNVFEDISLAIKTTANDLKNISMKLFTMKQDLKLVDQKEGE